MSLLNELNRRNVQGRNDALVGSYGDHSIAVLPFVYAQRGENDKAFEWLHQIHDISPSGIQYEPLFKVLHDDPRWQSYVDGLASSP
jgi:hypothetical protein